MSRKTAPDYMDVKALPHNIAPYKIISVLFGDYAVVDTSSPQAVKPRLLSSHGYLECMGVLAFTRDKTGKPSKWALAHLVIDCDPVVSVQNIISDMRGSNTGTAVEFVVFCGYHDFKVKNSTYTSDEFYEKVISTIKENVNCHLKDNFLYDETFCAEIAVDLESGKIYAGCPQGLTKPYIASSLLCTTAEKNNASAEFIARRKTRDEQTTSSAPSTIPALRYDWQACLPEMQQVWDRKKQSIMAELRKDFYDEHGNLR